MKINICYKFSKAKFFGEIAHERNNSASIFGTEISASRNFSFVVVWRKYDENFLSLHGLGFGERTETSKENGMYFGCSINPIRRANISLYYDQFSFPQQTFSAIFPSNGNDALLRFDIQVTEQLSISLQTQRKKTISNATVLLSGIYSRFDIEETKQRYRFTLESRSSSGFSFRNRIEFVNVKKDFTSKVENGFLVYCDVGKRITSDVTANFRIAFFHTDSFESRVSEFEKDVTGALNVPALYGKGIRWYVFLDWNIYSNLSLQTKYTATFRDDVKFIGTGESAFSTNAINTITMQLDWSM